MRVPQEYTAKVDKIKNIILSRSGLISEYGMNNVKIDKYIEITKKEEEEYSHLYCLLQLLVYYIFPSRFNDLFSF